MPELRRIFPVWPIITIYLPPSPSTRDLPCLAHSSSKARLAASWRRMHSMATATSSANTVRRALRKVVCATKSRPTNGSSHNANEVPLDGEPCLIPLVTARLKVEQSRRSQELVQPNGHALKRHGGVHPTQHQTWDREGKALAKSSNDPAGRVPITPHAVLEHPAPRARGRCQESSGQERIPCAGRTSCFRHTAAAAINLAPHCAKLIGRSSGRTRGPLRVLVVLAPGDKHNRCLVASLWRLAPPATR